MGLLKKTLIFVPLISIVAGAQTFRDSAAATGWQMQDSALVTGAPTGQTISTSSYSPSGWNTADVPGTVLTTLSDSSNPMHLYPDPTFGAHMRYPGSTTDGSAGIPDIAAAKHPFWYYATVNLSSTDIASGKVQWLCLDGINYMADIFMNGQSLPLATDQSKLQSTTAYIYTNGTTAGNSSVYTHSMIGTCKKGKFNVTGVAAAGTNYIAVRVYPNINPGNFHNKQANSCGSNGGGLSQDGPTFIQTQGWDWIPTVSDRAMGIYAPVYVITSGPVALRYGFARPGFSASQLGTNPLTGAVACTVSVQLRNGTKSAVTGDLHCVIDTGANAITIDSTVTVNASDTPWVTIGPAQRPALTIANPRLWYPNNYGNQDMYHVRMSFTPTGSSVSDSTQFNFGIRTVYAVRGNATLGLQVYINGRSFKERGGSWGIDDMLKHYNHHALEAKVRYHKDMNMNAIRNWIGGIDDDYFYQLCDAYGIVVWDDFWCPHSADGPSNLGTVIDTNLWLDHAAEKIKTYRSHPSIVFWNSRNEVTPITALWNGLLFRARALDGSGDFQTTGYTNQGPRICQQSSGTNDVHSGGPYSYLTPEQTISNITSFQTEFGGTIIPNIESERMFLPSSSDANFGTYTWDWGGYHDWCNMNGHPSYFTDAINQRIYNTAATAGAAPLSPTLADFCTKGQIFNYESYRATYEAMNSKLGKSCEAVCYWMTDPAWPSMMWQSFDYYLDPTAAVYGAKHANEPVHVQYYYTPGSTSAKSYSITNETYTVLTNYKVRARVFDMSGALSLTDSQTFATVPVDTTISGNSLPTLPTGLSQTYILDMRLTNASGAVVSTSQYIQGQTSGNWTGITSMPLATLSLTSPSVVWTKSARSLPVSGSSVQDSLKFTLKNTSAPVGVFARLKLVRATSGIRVLPVHYSDNFFTLPPGDSMVLAIDFYDADLNGEQPKLMLSGINIDSVQLPIGTVPVRTGNNSIIRQAGLYTSFVGRTLRLFNVNAENGWKVKLFDMQGRVVMSVQGAKGQAAVVSLARMHAGAYVATAESAGEVVRTKLILAN